MNDLILQAGKSIVETCSRLLPSEKAVIVTDRETRLIGDTIHSFAREVSDAVAVHVIEDYSKRPITFFPEEMEGDIKKSDVIYFAAQSYPGELKDFRHPLIKLATTVGREIHMPNISELIMETGMQANYFEVASLTYHIMGIATQSTRARLTSPAGTDLSATFSPRLKWVPDTGLLWYRGMFGNLPAGETYTCPESVDGVMVVDGILGDYFNEKFGDLQNTPVTIPVQHGRAVIDSVTCENATLQKEFAEYLRQDENANRVGEFACGTNTSLDHFVGNLLQDEKFPGVHIAFGYPYPDHTGADWESGGHVDGIMRECTLWFDDRMIMENGLYRIGS
ncbi:MAG: aminopeptidase [Theionarchaea archaeon]|nr:aminopeptidase [Theionarchaea archaeon]